MSAGILAEDFRGTPYWWDALPPEPVPHDAGLPESADVVVVGAGLTGVSTAHDLARAGRCVLVLDAGAPGEGASSRNHGMVGRNFKHPFGRLMQTVGLSEAIGYYRELDEAYDSAIHRIEAGGLDCLLRKTGRFIGALSPRHYEALAREYALRARHLDAAVEIVPADRQVEIGSPRYHGGVVIHDNAAIQPALHMRAMLERARRVGARVVGHTAVRGIRRDGDGFEIHTARGRIRAREVAIATNGMTPRIFNWHAQRLVPINAYTVMTEPLPAEVARALLPGHRTYHDNRRRSNPFVLAPDGSNRMLFSGRNGGRMPTSLRELAVRLHADMLFFFPALADTKLTHIWTGSCAATWDLFPHTGVHDGVHYATGYCFSGNAMAPYLGGKTAARILGRPEAATRFARPDFPRIPWPARGDWFMPAVAAWYSWADRPARVR